MDDERLEMQILQGAERHAGVEMLRMSSGGAAMTPLNETLLAVREALAQIKNRCDLEMDYDGYILSDEALSLLDQAIAQLQKGNPHDAA